MTRLVNRRASPFVFLLHGGAFSSALMCHALYAYLPQPAFYLAAGFGVLMPCRRSGRAGRLLDLLASARGRLARVGWGRHRPGCLARLPGRRCSCCTTSGCSSAA
jgi:hypothetical protein